MKEPRYFLAVFGDPIPPDRDAVESGKYYLGTTKVAITAERGDILLLYCTDAYSEHSLSVPGIGVVLTKYNDCIFYRYLPLAVPISRDQILGSFTEEDKRSFLNIRYNSFRMFEISRQSFLDTVRNASINW